MQDRLLSLRAGFQSHVPKPVVPEELVEVVYRLLPVPLMLWLISSVLLRGRETNIDAYVQSAIAQARQRRRPAGRPMPSQHVPITTSQPAPITPTTPRPAETEKPATTGETTRL